MKLVSSAEMREIDRVTIRERGVSGAELMDRAGRAVAREAMERFRPQSVAILAGKGNNGGDGLVAARALHDLGVQVTVYAFFDTSVVVGEAAEAFKRLPIEVKVERPENAHHLRAALIQYDVVIDALLGTGLRGAVSGLLGEVISELNACRTIVVSVDVPSGLLAGREQSGGPIVRATVTVTIGLPKLGLVLDPGARFAGSVSIADIGFPSDLLENPAITVNLLTAEEMRAALPSRDPSGHKGTFGRFLVLAGSEGMTGAAVLTARSALRSGVGLVYCGYPRPLGEIYESHLVEPVKRPLSGRLRWFVRSQVKPALAEAAVMQAVAIGPGLGQRPATGDFLREMVSGVRAPLLIDADGLNLLASETSRAKGSRPGWRRLAARKGPTVITPHPGEAARLLGVTIAEVERDRLGACVAMARECRAVVVLKGSQTIITSPEGQRYINPTGNSGLAKGGSGDVLTGLIGGLLAQGAAPLVAAQLGTFLHGVAADRAASKRGIRAMTPGDVVEHMGEAFLELERGTL